MHGCCTDANDVIEVWNSLGEAIVDTIIQNPPPEKLEIVVWDWSDFTPKDCIFILDCANTAYDNAEDQPGQPGQGSILADAIMSVKDPYNHVHLIGHSAGSNLIDEAALDLLNKSVGTGNKPFVHLTFLDAYTPLLTSAQSIYGISADYAEHYVDKTFGGLNPTNADLTYAFNFDITDCPSSNPSFEKRDAGHQWPIYWYQNSVTRSGFIQGYPLSLEGGNNHWLFRTSNLASKGVPFCSIPHESCSL